jgi:hypothetical protein
MKNQNETNKTKGLPDEAGNSKINKLVEYIPFYFAFLVISFFICMQVFEEGVLMWVSWCMFLLCFGLLLESFSDLLRHYSNEGGV